MRGRMGRQWPHLVVREGAMRWYREHVDNPVKSCVLEVTTPNFHGCVLLLSANVLAATAEGTDNRLACL